MFGSFSQMTYRDERPLLLSVTVEERIPMKRKELVDYKRTPNDNGFSQSLIMFSLNQNRCVTEDGCMSAKKVLLSQKFVRYEVARA